MSLSRGFLFAVTDDVSLTLGARNEAYDIYILRIWP